MVFITDKKDIKDIVSDSDNSPSHDELLLVYLDFQKQKEKIDINILKRRARCKKYYNTAKGKAKVKESQQRYYVKNRDKILKKYRDKRDMKKNLSNNI